MKYLFLLQKLQGAARGETRARARGHTLWGTQVSIFIFIVHKLKSLESQQAMFSFFALPFIRPSPPPPSPLLPAPPPWLIGQYFTLCPRKQTPLGPLWKLGQKSLYAAEKLLKTLPSSLYKNLNEITICLWEDTTLYMKSSSVYE